MRSQMSNYRSKYPLFYFICIQPDYGHLVSRNMYLVLILIRKNNVVWLQNTFTLHFYNSESFMSLRQWFNC